jgi:23S rRNA pseudouridine1911/1915/1917 synthase
VRDKDVDPESFVRPPGVDPAAILTVVRVPREWERWRLDRVVHATFSRMSRTRAQGVVRAGAFAPDGRKLRTNDRVRYGDVVLLYRPPFEEPDAPTECPVLYEDDVLLAIDKPSGLPVHPTARYHHKTVTASLARARPGEFLALCHRIDRETSGVLLLAKDRDAERFIKRALEVHVWSSLVAGGLDVAPSASRAVRSAAHASDAPFAVAKRYLCITWGVPSAPSGRIAHALKLDEHHPMRVKMRLADGEPDALSAATRYEVVAVRRAPGDPSRRYALVACDLETGRQHQIRIHLSATGTPLVGDKLYGPDDGLFVSGADGTLTEEDHARLELPRHALHAHRLRLPHPIAPHAERTIESPLPADMRGFWDALEEEPS